MAAPASTCAACGKKFGFFKTGKTCSGCRQLHCETCLVGLPDFDWLELPPVKPGNRCRPCYDEQIEPVSERYQDAMDTNEDVEVFMRSHEGKLPKTLDDELELVTSFRKQKTDALKELRITAAFHGYDMLTNVVYKTRTEKDESLRYKATGIAQKRAKR